MKLMQYVVVQWIREDLNDQITSTEMVCLEHNVTQN